MKANDFCVFVLSHNNPDNDTAKLLKRLKYTGKVFYVVDDQDTTVESYKNYYGEDSVCVFSKKKVAATIDVF